LWRGAFQPRPKGIPPRETVGAAIPALDRRSPPELTKRWRIAPCKWAVLRDGSLDAAAFLKTIQCQIEGTR